MLDWKKKKDNLIILNWFLAILWMTVIFISSSISSLPGTQTLSDQDFNFISSIVHVINYAVLAALLMRAFISSGIKTNKALVFGFLIAVFYGLTDEFHQFFVPGRESHLSDWLLDIAGSCISLFWYRYKIIRA